MEIKLNSRWIDKSSGTIVRVNEVSFIWTDIEEAGYNVIYEVGNADDYHPGWFTKLELLEYYIPYTETAYTLYGKK